MGVFLPGHGNGKMSRESSFSFARMAMILAGAFAVLLLFLLNGAAGQSIRFAWSGYGHEAQHDGLAPAASQPLNRILWQTPVDWQPQYDTNGELNIHYGSPVITRANTVIVPVKTGATDGFEVEALAGATGATNWTLPSDYLQPPHNWTLSFSPALTPRSRL